MSQSETRRGVSPFLPLVICVVSLVTVLGVAFAGNLLPGATSPSYTLTQSTNPNGIVSQSSDSRACATRTTYVIAYNMTTGRIVTMSANRSLYYSWGQIDVTCDPNLTAITTKGYLNAFYVDLQTNRLTLIPGVTFSSDYRQAYYNGRPIINGTRLPVPDQTATTSSTRSSPPSSPGALKFTMALNASSFRLRNNLTVSLNLYNTLGTMNDIPGAQDWQLTDQSEAGSPTWNCAQNDPFRTQVVAGYYDLKNFSKGTPLVFTAFRHPSGTNQCLFFVRGANNSAPPLFLTYSQNHYVFGPKSDKAQWIASGVDQPATMSETVLLEPSLFANSTGVFTVVCGDEWGDIQIAHFVLEPS